MIFFPVALVVAAAGLCQALVLPNNVGKLPALGWNSWNAYGCNINETDFLQAADRIVSLGFKDAGYNYVNIDDCWSIKSGRDNVTHQIIPDTSKFPDGISGLAKKVHDMGLQIGIYSSAGTNTCAGYPASIGYESIDAASFAAWGIDYLKYDNCYVPSNWTDACDFCVPDQANNPPENINGTCTNTTGLCPEGYDYSKSNTARRYGIMRDALEAQNRTIQFSLCVWGHANVFEWGNSTGNSWRIGDDINPSFTRVLEILNWNSLHMNSVNFWGHNDADMLEVGNGNLSLAEERTHFAFWAAMKSPLIIGTDLGKTSAEQNAILLNRYLLAFNQDPVYGAPATPYKWGVNPDWTYDNAHPAEYWAGDSTNGTLVLMLNTEAETKTMRANFSEIPGLNGMEPYEIVDVWSDKSLGRVRGGLNIDVAVNDTAVLLVKSCESHW